MRRVAMTVGLLVAAAVAAEAPPASPGPEPAAPPGGAAEIAELVERLGHPGYAERLDAQRRLLDAGLDAFDALREAQDNPDPEVADAARRLLAEITAARSDRSDPPLVRRWLDAYDGEVLGRDLDVVRALAKMPAETATPALARLARFAPSERAAAEAACLLLSSSERVPSAARVDAMVAAVTALRDRHGPGTRSAANWLDAFVREASGEAQTERWRDFAEGERLALERGSDDVSIATVGTLHWCWLRSALANGLDADAADAATALTQLREAAPTARLARAVAWASDAERNAVVDGLLETHADLLATKRGLYLRAGVAADRGRMAEADALAAEALAAETPDAGEDDDPFDVPMDPRFGVAAELLEAGRADWAIAEYESAARGAEDLEGEAVVAAWRLANLHFDAERYAEAAAALAPLVEKIERSRPARNDYDDLPQVQATPPLAPSSGELVARQKFSEALAARAVGDREGELAGLRRAVNADPRDADVLIAMHRVADPPPAFAAETRRRIDDRRRDFEREVWDRPERSEAYNQWAWLVGNTYGDFEKAVRYSRRSLEIAPETAGYLDTLARCLFAAGRLEEAVDAQRRAVELEPRMLVLRRQLEEFEAALDGGPPPEETP